MENMDIQISNVLVKIGKEKRKLFGISKFQIPFGTHLLLKGASGKGKTTFLHLLAGLLTPDDGSVRVGDVDLAKLSEEKRTLFRRHYMNMVFQQLNLIEHLTAAENIELVVPKQTQDKKISEALKNVGLEGREDDRTSVMSLGEQQRVAIARVLAGQAQIILADEPTSSLDEKNAFEVMDLLMKFSKGKTLVVVSHDQRIEKYFSNIQNFGELIN